jgi:hypothetical protein
MDQINFIRGLIFLVCFELFWCADLKNYFKKIKKNHFDAFWLEKHFKKQPQPHFQTCSVWELNLDLIKKIEIL